MYGLFISIAVLLCLHILKKLASEKQLGQNLIWQMAFYTLVFSVIGARLYHVMDFSNYYSAHPAEIIRVYNGGLSILGALLFGFATVVVVLFWTKQKMLQWLDAIAITLPLGQAVGRLGNLVNNELIPYAFYEIPLNILLFTCLYTTRKKTAKNGRTFFGYLIGYSIIRMLLEPVRLNHWKIGPVNVTIGLMLICLALSTVAFIAISWRKR